MDSLLVDRDGGVVTVTLNRPEQKNAVTPDGWGHLRDVLREIAQRDDDRVLVLTGADGNFCAGADLVAAASGMRRSPLEQMRLVAEAAHTLYTLPKPTIAKVDGVAVGAGCNMALCCDLVVASDRSRFSEIFARRALSLDFGGSWLLPRIVGLQRAKQLAFFGDVIDAPTASRFGLVTELVAADTLDSFVDGWARALATGAPVALSLTKALLDSSGSVSFGQALEAEAHAQSINLVSADLREALRAFVEKREPVFEGR